MTGSYGSAGGAIRPSYEATTTAELAVVPTHTDTEAQTHSQTDSQMGTVPMNVNKQPVHCVCRPIIQ